MQQKFDEQKLQKSVQTSLFSSTTTIAPQFGPNFISNNYQSGQKVLISLLDELETCESFDFSVAFITSDGLACLLSAFTRLKQQNIHGRILTTDYLTFTDPKALEKLLLFPNIELRVFTESAFHPKGYIFKQSNYYSIIVGSANLTQNALSRNQEWNLRIVSCIEGELVYNTRKEFSTLWDRAEKVTAQWLTFYTDRYKTHKQKTRIIPLESIEEITEQESSQKNTKTVPNTMQQQALDNLSALRAAGKNRAIIIAATGTGKTYLAAFDVRTVKPKKVLYIVHRETILKKSEESFRHILGTSIDTGFLTGAPTEKDFNASYLFASIYTIAKQETLEHFTSEEFDYIIVDEVHHSGAATYQKLFNYFHPRFLLGLTATPERTDKFDIFKFFDYNIASEIRLQQALEADLLCPFHYYGITDLTIDGETVTDHTQFKNLVNESRANHIIEAINLYRNNSEPIRGLLFCSRIDEAEQLSELLNEKGLTTITLSGKDSDDERERAISRLEDDTDPLEYILSVDIFNEGIDIPSVNQILLLRPTQSAIIFVQQLGRGLRKNETKKYLTVIDFIGNYSNNFMIPIALYGDNSLNKDSLRKFLNSGSAYIPGASTIDLDTIARKRIYEAISNAQFEQLSLLKSEYDKIKQRIGRVPEIMDFVIHDSINPLLFIKYSNSYYEFMCKMEKKTSALSQEHLKSLQFISLELAKGVRLHEIILLQQVIEHNTVNVATIKEELRKNQQTALDADIASAVNVVNGSFYKKADQLKYGNICYLDTTPEKIESSHQFKALLENTIYRTQLLQTLTYAIHSWKTYYAKTTAQYNLVLYAKYSRKDVCRLLNWKQDDSSTIYGYKTMHETMPYTCPIFVTYKKTLEATDSTNYNDYFIDNYQFNWMTRNKRTSKSTEVAVILAQKENGIKIPLFIKKDNGEGSDFYYMGDCFVQHYNDTTMNDGDNIVPVVTILFSMETPVRADMLRYLEESLS